MELLRWQLRLTWSLAQLHLDGLTDEMCRWEPAPGRTWSVHPDAHGRWWPDWAEPEPDPAPATSIGWLTWHLGWWWTTVLAHATGAQVPAREEVAWPGDAAAVLAQLTALHAGWAGVLETADPDRLLVYPWPEPRRLAQVAAWVNLELMKNVAEIGAARHLHQALRPA